MERIDLTASQPPPSLVEIRAFEAEVGHDFPESFRAFIQKNNGGFPPAEHQIWSDPDRELSLYVQHFFPLQDLLSERLSFPATLREELMPIALEGGGSYFLLDMDSGHIMLWDYESESIYDLAPSVGDLLKACTP